MLIIYFSIIILSRVIFTVQREIRKNQGSGIKPLKQELPTACFYNIAFQGVIRNIGGIIIERQSDFLFCRLLHPTFPFAGNAYRLVPKSFRLFAPASPLPCLPADSSIFRLVPICLSPSAELPARLSERAERGLQDKISVPWERLLQRICVCIQPVHGAHGKSIERVRGKPKAAESAS